MRQLRLIILSRPCTSLRPVALGRVIKDSSSQALPRHPKCSAYRCFLPDLAGFAVLRRGGPSYQYYPVRTEAFRSGL